jgi:hypothetical protein
MERKFATLYGKVRELLNQAKLTPNIRSKLWAEACKTASDLENTLVTKDQDSSPNQIFYGTKSPVLQHLQQFGEIGIVENHARRTFRGNLENRGRPCVDVGKLPSHNTDVYKFLNLETHRMNSSSLVTSGIRRLGRSSTVRFLYKSGRSTGGRRCHQN